MDVSLEYGWDVGNDASYMTRKGITYRTPAVGMFVIANRGQKTQQRYVKVKLTKVTITYSVTDGVQYVIVT